MFTNENGFLFTPGELTMPPGVLLDGAQHWGVAILLSRVTLTASDSDHAKALVICRQLKGVGLETDESAIRAISCSKSDT